jgi:hypothetical protein
MPHALLIQLPVPQINFGHQTGNIPFAAACLKQAAAGIGGSTVDILPQVFSTYAGDAAILDHITATRPDIIGFTVYLWNVERTLHLARQIKRRYRPRIVLGGPEVTSDNPLIEDDAIDFYTYGEGEQVFAELLQESGAWNRRYGHGRYAGPFETAPNPYLTIPLAPGLENIMLLETMRGCPHRCAYCFYNKSLDRPAFKKDSFVLDALAWARSRGVREIYFLDPALNNRPGLKPLLKQIAVFNSDHKLSLFSEIRAESIDDELADLLADAGFKWFEIGLQSTNPAALEKMHRPTNFDKFISGTQRLMKRNIVAAVDIIVGLPGDNLSGFDITTQFVVNHDLHHDIQVFPLSLIPGTEFRNRHESLGLIYEQKPPYTVISTPTFPREEILAAFDLAEDRFDTAIYPLPDLDTAWQTTQKTDVGTAEDIEILLSGNSLIYKVILRKNRPPEDLDKAARRLCHPYQLIIPPGKPLAAVADAVSIFTGINPHTPLELVFFSPEGLPDVDRLLNSAKILRPHYLDNDMRLLYRNPGNRAMLFTVVSESMEGTFSGPMHRHIFWWKRKDPPDKKSIDQLEENGFDGILVDCPTAKDKLCRWQDDMAPLAGDIIYIGFAWTHLHKRWLGKTSGEDYCLQVLP